MREVVFGKRILFLDCISEASCFAYDGFLEVLYSNEDFFNKIMDNYGLPSQVMILFRDGDGGLEGQYFVQQREVSKHVVVIEIYSNSYEDGNVLELVDTFVHEIVHNQVASESKTRRIVKGLLRFMK